VERMWEVEEKSVIICGGTVVLEKDGAITAEEILEAARKVAVKKFVVKDINGSELSPADFPRTGTFIIAAYNEAA
jgi:hypothetical protein